MKIARFFIMAGFAAAALGIGACAKERQYPQAPYFPPLPSGEFPITASYAFYQPFINDQQFQWVKEAGFNVIAQNNPLADLDSCLKLAEKYGLYVNGVPYGISDLSRSRSLLLRYKDEPNIWGFCMFDEPNASQFPHLKDLNDTILKYAPEQFGFFNLLPRVGAKQLGAPDYRTYVEDYVMEVNPPFISFDIYPVQLDGQNRLFVTDGLYATLEVVRDVAMESGRPFHAYVLSNKHWHYPKPKEEYIRFSAFTSLAYGAQGLRYYTYQIPDFDRDGDDYSLSPIDRNGKKTVTWNMVRNVNREVLNLSKVFQGAEVLSVTQTGERIPESTRRTYRLPAPFRGIESFGEGVTVSHLRNGDNEYLVLVNRDVQHKQKIRLSRTRPVTRLFGDGTERADSNSNLTLEPGGYAIFRL